MDYIVVETGQRNVAQADYKGYRIEVATGYSAMTDNWPIHIYVQKIAFDGRLVGAPEKLELRGHAGRKEEAFDAGMNGARLEIDQR